MVVGDWNDDGKPDVATANYSSNSVTVLTGDGTGHFGSRLDRAVGVQPNDIATGDLDEDGHADLVVCNYAGPSKVSVLRGDGAGGFAPAVGHLSAAVSGNSRSIGVADLNGDGHQDIAVLSPSPSSTLIQVLLGNGSGGFAPVVESPVPTQVIDLVLGDFNGDGKLDAAGPAYEDQSVVLLMGDGTGTFTAVPAFPVGMGSLHIFSADLLGDGSPALVVLGWEGSSTRIALLGPDGSGQLRSLGGFNVSHLPAAVAAGDLDGNGRLDLVFSLVFFNRVLVALDAPTTNLTVSLDDGLTVAMPGQPATYTLTVANNGPQEVRGLAFTT